MAARIHYSLNVEVETVEFVWPVEGSDILGDPTRDVLEYRSPDGDRWYYLYPCTFPFNERASKWASARGVPVTFNGLVLCVSAAEYGAFENALANALNAGF